MVEQSFAGYVLLPFKVPYNITAMVNGVEVCGQWNHRQFILNTTFRGRTSAQLAKEKKSVKENVQTYDITEEIDSKDDYMGL